MSADYQLKLSDVQLSDAMRVAIRDTALLSFTKSLFQQYFCQADMFEAPLEAQVK